MKSTVTSKFQATVPKEIREKLDLKPGDSLEWRIVREFVVVNVPRKIKNPVEFLSSQIELDLDAVKLVQEVREECG
ncbi:MAG: AbrB/MazE/SpoVT family DNA-binding domain-containing protein [Candidatus Ranarchaeia archaeon]